MESDRSKKHVEVIIVLGDSGVGKSSLLMRFAEDKFSPNFISTIGIDMRDKFVEMDGKRVRIRCWGTSTEQTRDTPSFLTPDLRDPDSAGQERFRNITANYYRGVHGVLLVYDITDSQSFKNALVWADTMSKFETTENVKGLMGNKCDLVDQRRVTLQEGEELARQLNCSQRFWETSAKTSTNCEEAFMAIAKQCFEKKLFLTSGGVQPGPAPPAPAPPCPC